MLIVRKFKITYSLKEPNSVSMYIEQWTYYRVREQSVCNNAHSEEVQNNLQPEGTKFSIHVHRAVDILEQSVVTMLIVRWFKITYSLDILQGKRKLIV